jgi:hypothetical protein
MGAYLDKNGSAVHSTALAKGDGTSDPPIVQVSGFTGTPSVSVSNFPATQPVTLSGDPDVRLAGDAGTILGTQTSVAASAHKLPTTTLSGRRTVLIRNTDKTNSVFLGASGVTTSTGFELVAGAAVVVPASLDVYGITASATVRVDTLELS